MNRLNENKCPHCGAFYTKTVKAGIFGKKDICSNCKEVWDKYPN